MENSARLRFISVGISTTSSTVLRIWWLNWPIMKILQKFQVHSNNDERHEHSHGLLQRLEQSRTILKDICFVRRQLKDINKFLRICLNKMNGSKWRHYRFVKRIKKFVVQDTVDSFETWRQILFLLQIFCHRTNSWEGKFVLIPICSPKFYCEIRWHQIILPSLLDTWISINS